MHLRYSDIYDDDGVWLLEVDNIKVNALLGMSDNDNKHRLILPIIPSLYKVLLEECDFDSNKGKAQYIFGPESSRPTVHAIISRGFTHFKQIAQIDGKKSFKELRTTYITAVGAKYGEKYATTVTDHSSIGILKKHYLNQKTI